jgi:hypothetical protein
MPLLWAVAIVQDIITIIFWKLFCFHVQTNMIQKKATSVRPPDRATHTTVRNTYKFWEFHRSDCSNCGFLGCDTIWNPEDSGRMFPKNIHICLQDYVASQPRRPQFWQQQSSGAKHKNLFRPMTICRKWDTALLLKCRTKVKNIKSFYPT